LQLQDWHHLHQWQIAKSLHEKATWLMSSFTTSIAKQPTLCPTLWPASLKTHSHRVKHMVKLLKHGSLPRSCFLKNSSTGEAELCQTGP
jgi:hypothetical protein